MTNILIIDDDPEITTLLKTILLSKSRQVQTAQSGRDGMRMLAEHRFDIVITDIIMPDLDGFEVIMAINKMMPRPTVIAMTGGSSRLNREYLADMAKALNVQRVLFKPFTIAELLEAILQREGCSDVDGGGESPGNREQRGKHADQG